ncbi:MAG: NADPH-dependent F420 reductase [Thermoproteota archaeon]|jgi:NADPH-dependent F420 reductase|nr:NADPH-dependent F420 reductase [Thermoproteota archaeon]RPI83234.1 MAG: F420-dependent NADP oxidoreductase [Nitrosopumilales archaeon]
MKIGIIGAGDVGGTLGMRWRQKGHEIMFGVRNRQSQNVQKLIQLDKNLEFGEIIETVTFGDVIVLAVPWTAIEETIHRAGNLSNKILIDPTNPLTTDLKGLALDNSSAAEKISNLAKSTKVVKAFNIIGAKTLNNSIFDSQRADIFICGNDSHSKQVVRELAIDIGFDVVDVGPLVNARMLEYLALIWIELAFRQQLGPNIAFKLLRRKADF